MRALGLLPAGEEFLCPEQGVAPAPEDSPGCLGRKISYVLAR